MDFQEHEIKHLKQLENITSECALFLKREDESFPLDINVDNKIGLYGNGVRYTIKGGTGSGNVDVHKFYNIEEVFLANHIEITSKYWLDQYDEIRKQGKKEFKKRIRKEAHQNHVLAPIYAMGSIKEESEYDIVLNNNEDVAIYVLSRDAGEGSDRRSAKGDFYLTDTEIKTILALNKTHKKFLLVLNVPAVIDISSVLEVKNILLLSQLGSKTSETLFDIVYGKKYPSGKLSTTWAKLEDYPNYKDFAGINDTNYVEGIYVGYRYFDSFNKNPIFEFGYGKSYTDFKIEVVDTALEFDDISMMVKVTNIGKYVGKEVVQLYLRKPTDNMQKCFQNLVQFEKTEELKPGEEAMLCLSFRLTDFADYDEENSSYILPKGIYHVAIGNSSRNLKPIVSLELRDRFIVKKVKNIETKLEFKELANDTVYTYDKLKRHYAVDLSKLKTDIQEYEEYKVLINPIVEKLNLDQLIKLSLGNISGGIALMVGDTCSKVFGGAGETCLGLPNINSFIAMCDGPAGLRMCKEYIATKNKKFKIAVDPIMDTIREFLPKIMHGIFGGEHHRKKKGIIHYQYATAIPIATALAQSFSREVIATCGNIVREEMELYGADLWLAPAMNIHRHILCGRNFEYYSEDPFLTGESANAIIKSIQKYNQKGVTIKHFACNNQETNRTNNSSNLSMRAFREIYLKGFEMAIKKNNPSAIMMSYNLINGVHTSESHYLVNDIIRNEFNYEGLIMTDWISTGQMKRKDAKYPYAHAYKNILAGTNLSMPGGSADVRDIKRALKIGLIDRETLLVNASIVLDNILKFS